MAVALAQWGNRFTSNGTDYGDFTATLARITRWADWCREWGVTATRYEQLAEAAQDAGERQTAAGAWQRAALAWHWGKFVFTDDPAQQRAAHERTVACFRRAAPALSPPAELVRVPYGSTTLPWDELPPQTKATFQARSGARSADEARALAGTLTLEEAARHIDTPLLVVGSGMFVIAPVYHQERLAKEVRTAELVVYPDGSHGVTNRAFESRSRMADWMAARLTA